MSVRAFWLALLAGAGLAAGAASAQDGAAAEAPAWVAAVQPPVWMERAGQRTALKPGAKVYAGDRIATGAGGRAHLALQDDSIVKLGQDAGLDLPRLQVQRDAQGEVLSGALNVLKGAFRYTTRALGKLKRRDLNVTIGGVITAGVRGTDIWGKSDAQQNLICLLEGSIDVQTEAGAPVRMADAGTFYVVPAGQPARPVEPAPPGTIAEWAPQTELDPAAPTLSADGQWTVGLASNDDMEAARRAALRLWELGYPAEVFEVRVGDRAWYRLTLGGFASPAEARRFLDTAKTLGFRSPWVLRSV